MPAKSKVELYAAIRRDSREGLSTRAIQRKHHVTWSTVNKALTSAWPEPRQKPPPRGSRLDPYKPAVDAMLLGDLDAPRKQRHTVRRITDRLIEEHGMTGVSYQMVREYVAERKPQIRIEAGRGPEQVFIPQSHKPGAEAEVDFGDVVIRLRGELVTCALFAFRLSFSARAIHKVSISAGQEAFLEGHVHALETLGGVPTGRVRYDNLKAAVAQVLGLSRARVETQRWIAFKSHYDLQAFYCQRGKEGAHEKGGVEGEIGRFRRRHLVPVPEVDSIAELNAMIGRWEEHDDTRRAGSRVHTVAEAFAQEKPLLKPLPDEPFETGLWLSPHVDRFARLPVRANRYSVPIRYIGRQVRVLLSASEMVIYDNRTEIARHERLPGKAQERLELDHYLEGLLRKPGALPGSTALEQARAAGKFTPVHDAWWAAVVKTHGDREGTRALINVLLLHRHMPDDHVVAGLAAALRAGALTADAVALEARKAADTDSPGTDVLTPESTPSTEPGPVVTSLTQRRLTQLHADERKPPSVTAYDQLLHRSSTTASDLEEGQPS
jgi:transposase